MKAMIVYDSFFGNTEKIAAAIAEGLGSAPDVTVTRVGDVQPAQLQGLALLVVGSPTRAFRPSPATLTFLTGLAEGSLAGTLVAAFDTRSAPEKTPGFLKFLMRIFGYAAKPIGDRLAAKGGRLAAAPEGFAVLGSEGPLKDGEVERATAWGKTLAAAR